jgi:DNA-binding PadR family transcriptional regulator
MFPVNIFSRNSSSGDFGPLTSMEFEILLSLAEVDRHGYAILQDIAARSDGAVTARPGTLYRAISRLLQSDLIRELTPPRAAGDPLPRRTNGGATTL